MTRLIRSRTASSGLRRCLHRSHRYGLPCLREWSWQHRCYRHVTCNPCPKEF